MVGKYQTILQNNIENEKEVFFMVEFFSSRKNQKYFWEENKIIKYLERIFFMMGKSKLPVSAVLIGLAVMGMLNPLVSFAQVGGAVVACGCYCGKTISPPCSEERCKQICDSSESSEKASDNRFIDNKNGTAQAGEIHDAAKAGDVTKVRQLLKQGVDVNAKDDFSRSTPLHVAAFNGYTDVVTLLIQKGADVNARDDFGQTPLHRASGLFSNANVARLLIEKGADVNAKSDVTRGTPLHQAALSGKTDVARLLIEKGADVNARDEDQNTPAMSADKNRYPEAAAMIRTLGGK